MSTRGLEVSAAYVMAPRDIPRNYRILVGTCTVCAGQANELLQHDNAGSLQISMLGTVNGILE